jgi:hypothetical protein
MSFPRDGRVILPRPSQEPAHGADAQPWARCFGQPIGLDVIRYVWIVWAGSDDDT